MEKVNIGSVEVKVVGSEEMCKDIESIIAQIDEFNKKYYLQLMMRSRWQDPRISSEDHTEFAVDLKRGDKFVGLNPDSYKAVEDGTE